MTEVWGGNQHTFGTSDPPLGLSKNNWSYTRGIPMESGWQYCTKQWRLIIQWNSYKTNNYPGAINIQLMKKGKKT